MKIRSKKNKKRIFIAALILTFVFLFDVVYARFVISRDYDKKLKSVPFYFDAVLASPKVEFEEDMAEFNIVVRNFDDSSITSNPIDYEMSLAKENQERFQLDGATSGKLSGSEKDERTIKLMLMSDELIENGEEVTLIVTATSPYKKVIEIPITIEVNQDYYSVHYEIQIDGETIVINDSPTELQ